MDQPPPVPDLAPDALAYVIYTSGTTGQPKGVLCTHRGITRLVRSDGLCTPLPSDRVAHVSSVLFDITLPEIWGPLLSGCPMVIAPPGPPDMSRLPAVLRDGKVTMLYLATSVFHLLVDECPEALANLRRVITGGEILSIDHARRALAALPSDAILVNGYGPTENATFSTLHVVTPADLERPALPIGRCVENSSVHVLDPFGHPLPPGIPGELVVGGDGVALGYLERPDLTAARFLSPNPYPVPEGMDGARAYRTGDWVVRDGDGLLYFLGRRDNQIKIRGFRVELDEITRTLRDQPGVRDGLAVAPMEEGGRFRRLVAYLAPNPAADLGPDPWATVRAGMARSLPAHMVPDVGVILPNLPLNAVGKVDRTALPPPETTVTASTPRRAPRTETERAVLAIWGEVLDRDDIGLDDDLFSLGGDSLHATQVASRLARRLEMDVSIALVLSERSCATLAERLDGTALSAVSSDDLAAILADLDLDLSAP